MTATTRELAFLVIRDTFGTPPRAAQASFEYRVGRSDFDERDRAFIAELAYGTIKARRLLDWLLRPYLQERQNTLPYSIAEILRLGVYQLLCMDGVAAHAAVYETVGLAMRYGHRGTAGLVNAVLRRVENEQPPLPKPEDFTSILEYIAVRASLPTWIVERLAGRFGEENLEAMCLALNGRSQKAFTVDLRHNSVEAAIAHFASRELNASASPFASDSLVLEHAPHGLQNEEKSRRGIIQSESAAMPVDLLNPMAGEKILEFCAGRGNKTLQIAARLAGTGHLEAIELDLRKVQQLEARLLAAHEQNITVRCIDACHAEGDKVDAVLVDAPCSGLGILGRHPEARWRKQPEDAERHSETQLALVRAAFTRLRSGGRLVYSVCSPDPCEGEAVIDRLLATEPDLERVPAPERYAQFRAHALSGDLVVPPGLNGRDGFFLSLLRRR